MSWRRAPDRLRDVGLLSGWQVGFLWAVALALAFAVLGFFLMEPLERSPRPPAPVSP